jgi:hypothetical protein
MSFLSIQLLCGACYDMAKGIWQQARTADADEQDRGGV